jgi:hypothetical protein
VSELSGHPRRRACMLATPAAGADMSAELRYYASGMAGQHERRQDGRGQAVRLAVGA